MDYNQLIASCSLAFGSGQFDESLSLSVKAIAMEPKRCEGYNWAGKSCMSLDRPDDVE